MKLLFWILVGLCFYTYAGYPAVLWLLSRMFPKKIQKQKAGHKVSLILSAFNEEKYIERKLQNLIHLAYPQDNLEIIIGSDGASDLTDQIISKFVHSHIRFFRFVANQGKPQVLNSLVREARGEILVFTDARQDFDSYAIQALVQNFSDPKVGCVSGELIFRDIRSGNIGKGMDVYWKYEKFLRKHEGRLGSMLGATGAIYAIRRHLFTPLPPDILVDDMYLPLSIIAKGFRAVFESDALAYDHTSAKGKEEFKRKVRTLTGNYQIFQMFPNLLNPFQSPIAFQLISHKLMRLLVPFWMIGIFIANFNLSGEPFYAVLFMLQLFFYLLAFVEAAKETLHFKKLPGAQPPVPAKKRIGYIPYTFCLLNYAALRALLDYLLKRTQGSWEKAYG